MRALLYFAEDQVALPVEEIALVRGLDEGDMDPQTGQLLKTIPEGKLTRIDTRSAGYVWVSMPFDDVLERLKMVVPHAE